MNILGRRIAELIAAEKPWDADAETAFGVGRVLADAYGFDQSLSLLGAKLAANIWWERFIAEPRLDAIAEIDATLALALLDAAVESGVPAALRWLQVALNALGGRSGRWPELDATGWPGAMTLYALRRCIDLRGDGVRPVLLGLLVAQRATEALLDAVDGEVVTAPPAAWARLAAIAGAPHLRPEAGSVDRGAI